MFCRSGSGGPRIATLGSLGGGGGSSRGPPPSRMPGGDDEDDEGEDEGENLYAGGERR